jgi:peptidyl-prolyl cis-trans isomerase B (cyclophilin B)
VRPLQARCRKPGTAVPGQLQLGAATINLARVFLLILLLSLAVPQSAPQPKLSPFTTPQTLDQMRDKQAVLETTAGRIVIDLLPESAPNHVGYFIKLAGDGAYDGTTFHRLVNGGIVQGGDPLSKDPARRDLYGTGGLGVLKAEIGGAKHVRGAVSGVIVPGKPDSGGAQFFICVVDQPALDGQYSVFGRVVEGINVVAKISASPVDEKGKATDRIEIRSATIRDRPVEGPEPFSTESAVDLGSYRVVLETTAGAITVEMRPDRAPEHVRNFLRLASAGVYDGTAFHRVVRGFVIQGGSMNGRREPLDERAQRFVRTVPPEFNDIPHVKGTLSMARGDDPASASTSFFICTAPAPALDRVYTAFGRVVAGMAVVEAIEAAPVDGERPTERIELLRARVERIPKGGAPDFP